MAKITIKDKTIDSDGPEPYVVAEIGCNHCGDFKLCLEMVRVAAECGADAVKLQKRNNKQLFTAAALAEPYHSAHAYGATYGEHREALDWFGYAEFGQVSDLCASLGLGFIATPFTNTDAEFLVRTGIELSAFKIASCDLTNTPLIEQVSWYGKPVIISTGGGSRDDIYRAADVVHHGTEYALLHCVSSYPNRDARLDLAVIHAHGRRFSYLAAETVIGFSSHHPGLLPHYIAYMLGARIFEVHFTLNRGFKGTDHGFSVEPAGLRKLCEDLGRIPVMMGFSTHNISFEETNGFVRKMGKSIYAARAIKKGETITAADLYLRAPAAGDPPYRLDAYIGLSPLVDTEKDTPMTAEMFRWG